MQFLFFLRLVFINRSITEAGNGLNFGMDGTVGLSTLIAGIRFNSNYFL
jgi:hypothetical protein